MVEESFNLSFAGRLWRRGSFQSGVIHIVGQRLREGRRGRLLEVPFIIPPLADPHLHGGWGLSFQQGEFAPLEERLKRIGVLLAIPTLYNDRLEHVREIAQAFSAYRARVKDSIFPYLRIEGPFISSAKKGAQDKNFILPAEPALVGEFLSISEIKMFTFAPEVPGSPDLVARALAQGKIPSIGHSQAVYDDFARVYRLGVRHMTHYPNALSNLHHREIGLVGAGLLHDDLQLEVIGDGVHTSYEFLELLRKLKGDGFALTSDLIPPALAEDKDEFQAEFIIEGRKITTRTGVLAGGATPVPEQVVGLRQRGWPPETLVRLACENTRRFFGWPLYSLEEGAEATFLLCGENLEVRAVFEKGICLWRAKEWAELF